MHNRFLTLASVLVLSLTPPGWAAGSGPLPRAVRAEPTPPPARELLLTGELRYYRHIDPVTGRGAVSLHADGKEIPLDFREFKVDILFRPGLYVVEGYWGEGRRLVVTAARTTGCRRVVLP
jgi:hypothetical protein